MTKQEFESVFEQKYAEILNNSANDIKQKLSKYANGNQKISLDALVSFCYIESFNASADLIKNLLEDVLKFDD